jgi:hypothetical protein
VAADPRLRPRGHRDLLLPDIACHNFGNILYLCLRLNIVSVLGSANWPALPVQVVLTDAVRTLEPITFTLPVWKGK